MSGFSRTLAADGDGFADDLRRGLLARPRRLDPKYFYDDLGSALFDAICHLPWYRITRAERALLEVHASEILADVPAIVELGCGSGEKLLALLEAGGGAMAGVHLVDVSEAALAETRQRLDVAGLGPVCPHRGSYEAGLHVIRANTAGDVPVLVLFLGSNIGNFDAGAAQQFLADIRQASRPGDRLLLGTDLVKPERELLLAYDDPLGVTAAFNLNLLNRINAELGGTFDLALWQHLAIWNAQESRIEMHLVSKRRQHARVDAAGLDLTFEDGESIWTESSYKYEPAQVASMLSRAGFSCTRQWLDERARFLLTFAAAV